MLNNYEVFQQVICKH